MTSEIWRAVLVTGCWIVAWAASLLAVSVLLAGGSA
jgi:hypothetical protein